jgi:regulator of sigma E protease
VVTAKKISGAESALDAAVGSEANGMNHNSGVVVGDVEKESDAYRAGLRAGDRLTAVNGEHVSSWTELQIEFLLAGRSGPVSLNVMRDDTVMKMKIPLSNNNALGLWILEGVHPEAQTIVSEVLEGSPANAAGIKVGDALYSMNGIPILWPDYFIKLVTANGGKRIDLVVLRGGQKTNISIQPRFDEVHKRHVIGIKLELRK